ncbi:MAG: peptidase, partial [Segetibacter sp.]|nr:peptidase [Segetibacter sp.]
MRRIIVSIALLLSVLQTHADEGMWLPLLLGQQVYNNMVKRGLKLKPEQLYSANKSSLKDAIIIFGNGCTGEIVSSQGLVFTNHHCGYGQIAAASTVEANYLRDGFWAANKTAEIPSRNLTVRFLNRIEDVTKKVLDSLGGLTGASRTAQLESIQANMVRASTNGSEFKSAVVASMFKGNQYFLFVYDIYKDVRLVGTPPESIGKFGGDTDNWEWPRHTGDFSVFRVYMGPDGKPANYSATNVPYKPKHYLPISIKGIKDGDYAMTYGYPGGTNRYETSYGIKLATDINNPSLVKLRDMRLKFMSEEMKKSPATKLQLASSFASIANYWKFYEGETKQLLKYDVYGQKQKSETDFIKWAANKPEFANLFSQYQKNYEVWRPYAQHRVYIEEGIKGSPLLKFANTSWIDNLEKTLAKKGVTKDEINKAVETASNARQSFIAEENIGSDLNIIAGVLRMFYEDVDKSQQPTAFYNELFSTYGNTPDAYFKYSQFVIGNTMAFSEEKW